METLKMIESRRAVRQYTGQISDEQLNSILLAANAGPVGLSGYEAFRLTVIQDPNILSKLSGIYEAPTVIIISAKEPDSSDYLSAGAIVHNMELAAEDLGLGANYNMASLHSYPKEIIPNGFEPVFAITIGQTEEEFTPRDTPMDRIKTNIVK